MSRNRYCRRLPAAVGSLLLACATLPVGAQAPAAAPAAAAPRPPVAAPAPAATPAPAARSADVEPGFDTSAPARSATVPLPGASAAPAQPAPSGRGAARSGPQPQPAAAQRGGRAMDRVDLESSQITGNRELPRVLYIVPWRAPAAGDIEGRPVNSLLYELTKPVDRDVFRRENRYFDALAAQSPKADASASEAPDAGGPEK